MKEQGQNKDQTQHKEEEKYTAELCEKRVNKDSTQTVEEWTEGSRVVDGQDSHKRQPRERTRPSVIYPPVCTSNWITGRRQNLLKPLVRYASWSMPSYPDY